VLTKLTRQSKTTQNKHAGALTEALHGDAYHPESLRGWQVVTEDQHGTTRIKQSHLVRWLPTPSKPGPSALQEGGPSYRKDGNRVAEYYATLDEECT
jgi:hypothetical protein